MTSVVIVDDHALFRSGVRTELDGLVDVLGDAATVEDAVRLVLEAEPDVVVLDVQMPGGGAPVDVYAEAAPDRLTVFVRDRGAGFDVSAVPDDRRGVRESIVGRMARHGGRAEIHSAPQAGTEVELTMPRSAP